jgi:hypothetical protein
MIGKRYYGDKVSAESDARQLEFLRQKKQLKQYFKQLKAGMIQWEDVPYDYQLLLTKYYGM